MHSSLHRSDNTAMRAAIASSDRARKSLIWPSQKSFHSRNRAYWSSGLRLPTFLIFRITPRWIRVLTPPPLAGLPRLGPCGSSRLRHDFVFSGMLVRDVRKEDRHDFRA